MSAASQVRHGLLQTPASAGTTHDSASSRRQHTPACTAFCPLFSGYLLQSRIFHAFSPPEARLSRIYKSFIIYQLLFPMRISSSSLTLHTKPIAYRLYHPAYKVISLLIDLIPPTQAHRRGPSYWLVYLFITTESLGLKRYGDTAVCEANEPGQEWLRSPAPLLSCRACRLSAFGEVS